MITNKPDQILVDIATYVLNYKITSPLAYDTAYYCLLDSIGCGLEALDYTQCTKLLGPIVENTIIPNGAKVFATSYQLDPIQAAFNIGTMIRWLDYNDTWLAAEWGHPSDNLGAILALSDWLSRNNKTSITINEILTGLDHVILVKLASTAVSCQLLGLNLEQTINALSLVFTDGQALRTYRHFPNTGSRKSWAAGDATSRGVKLALMAQKGEMGYPSVLTTPIWGFYDVSFGGKPFVINQEYNSYVMENILFKISYPAEFHAQTAVECAIQLHNKLKDRLEDIDKITIRTHNAAIRIIDKQGKLNNPADRDHCIQYIVSIALIFGRLTAQDYEDDIAQLPIIDIMRSKITCIEDKQFSSDYLDPEKRSIANAITIYFKDGTKLDEVVCEYPIGHKKRRIDGIPLLMEKFKTNLKRRYDSTKQEQILNVIANKEEFKKMPIHEFMSLLSI